jgi:hypothetical protein
MTGAAWLHGKVKVGLPDGAELRCTSSVFETHRNGKESAFGACARSQSAKCRLMDRATAGFG